MLRELLFAGTGLAVLGAYAQGPVNMVAGEYWVDVDNGWGQGTPITGLAQPNVAGVQFQVPTDSLSAGMHTIGMRTKDEHGRWSLTNVTPVFVDKPDANAAIIRTEYFLNTDPGWGAGLDAEVDGVAEVPPTATSVSLAQANVGMNTLFVRSQDAHGHWSLTNRIPLYVDAADEDAEIVKAESFWDVDPGFDHGDPVSDWTPGADVSGQFNIAVPIDIGLGFHQLYLRTRDSHGHWSLTNWQIDSVNVNGTVDVNELTSSAGISAYPNPFNEGITVHTADGQPLHVVLYDPQGKLVHDKVLTGGSHIDLIGHAQGAYTAFFWKEAKRIHRVTLIKQ